MVTKYVVHVVQLKFCRGWRAVFDMLQNITGCTVDFLNRGRRAAFVGVIADLDNFFEIWETLSFQF